MLWRRLLQGRKQAQPGGVATAQRLGDYRRTTDPPDSMDTTSSLATQAQISARAASRARSE
jgi:hypothetical protein